MTAHATVAVVTVTYNSAHIFRADPTGVPVAPWVSLVFVDNASSDGSADELERLYPDARVIRNDENVGFARAVNRGARDVDSDYVLLLNPDAAISAGELEKLTRYLDENPQVGIAAPIVQDSAAEFATLAAGFAPTTARMFTHATGLSRLSARIPALRGHYLFASNLASSGAIDVDWVSGGCMLVRQSVWQKLGGLSERWFMYAEDIEFCLRARAAGERVAVFCGSRAIHEIGQSSTRVDGRVNPAWILNLYELYRLRIAKTPAAAYLWKVSVVAGFEARAGVYALLAATRGRTPQRAANVRRFKTYSAALRHAPHRLIRD